MKCSNIKTILLVILHAETFADCASHVFSPRTAWMHRNWQSHLPQVIVAGKDLHVLKFRGGKSQDKKTVGKVDDQEDNDLEDVDADIIDSTDMVVPTMLKEVWGNTPPVTKGFLTASIFFTMLASMFNQNQWFKALEFDWIPIITRLEVTFVDVVALGVAWTVINHEL